MENLICLHSTTALELYRSWDLKVPDLFDVPRTSSLASCTVPGFREVEDRLMCVGLHEQPYHILVGNDRHAHSNKHVTRHVWSSGLPSRSLIRIAPGILCPSPELLFVQMAQETARRGTTCSGEKWRGGFCRFPWVDEVELALLGFELCGTYFLTDDEDGFRTASRSVTSVHKIKSYLARQGRQHGIGLARKATALIQDGAHSPMETAMALQLTAPRRVGGMGLPQGTLNCKLATLEGDRWVDLGWRKERVGIEYLGKKWHADPERDDRRRNAIVGSGMNLFIARFRDLSRIDLFDELSCGIARALGVRLRVRDREFRARRAALWAKVLPPLDCCASGGLDGRVQQWRLTDMF